jgi:hypothetical protein
MPVRKDSRRKEEKDDDHREIVCTSAPATLACSAIGIQLTGVLDLRRAPNPATTHFIES